jgi:hypothetical protein
VCQSTFQQGTHRQSFRQGQILYIIKKSGKPHASVFMEYGEGGGSIVLGYKLGVALILCCIHGHPDVTSCFF